MNLLLGNFMNPYIKQLNFMNLLLGNFMNPYIKQMNI